MPSVTLHMVLADRVLDRWKDAPSRAPFNPFDPNLTNAFYQGAIGPDLGYFPGGQRLLSDLSHLVQSGDLSRTLVESADSPRERAFSWGWVTHVLGDMTIHPHVGRGVGELLLGDRERFVDGASQPVAHVQIETGIDTFYSYLFPALRHRNMAPVFDGSSIRYLVQAYLRTYRAPLDPTLFISSHLATVRMSVQGLRSIGVMSTTLLHRPVSSPMVGAQWLLQRTLSAVKGGIGRGSLLMAYLNPIPPAEWLVESVGKVVESFGDIFFQHFDSGLANLENYNLDTGQIEGALSDHSGTQRVIRLLKRWKPQPAVAGLPGFRKRDNLPGPRAGTLPTPAHL